MTDNQSVLERFQEGGVLLDGAMGSLLIANGLKTGELPEEWNQSKPSIIRRIHKSYLEAGAHVIETNTFGGTPSRLASYGLGDALDHLNTTAVHLAREALNEFDQVRKEKQSLPHRNGGTSPVGEKKLIAFSIGPTGKMLSPVGKASEDEIKTEFEAQIEIVGGTVDLFIIETMFDIREGILALIAAKELESVPVAVTLTFNKNPRGFFTVMGDEAGEAMKRLEAAGADIVGANCTIASKEMVELGRTLRDSTTLPILCQPNAGNPTVKDGVPVYEQTPRDFAEDAIKLYGEGINAVGGCCGTTPDFIRECASRICSQ